MFIKCSVCNHDCHFPTICKSLDAAGDECDCNGESHHEEIVAKMVVVKQEKFSGHYHYLCGPDLPINEPIHVSNKFHQGDEVEVIVRKANKRRNEKA